MFDEPNAWKSIFLHLYTDFIMSWLLLNSVHERHHCWDWHNQRCSVVSAVFSRGCAFRIKISSKGASCSTKTSSKELTKTFLVNENQSILIVRQHDGPCSTNCLTWTSLVFAKDNNLFKRFYQEFKLTVKFTYVSLF